MKLFLVSFFENDGDGCVERLVYGIYDNYDLAMIALKEVVTQDGYNFNNLYVTPSQYLYDKLFEVCPKYGAYSIEEYELNKTTVP